MAASRTGTPSIYRLSNKMKQVYLQYGAADMETKLGSTFKACVIALVNCVIAYNAADDVPFQIDTTTPLGPEDLGP